jgi:hypothetical protein
MATPRKRTTAKTTEPEIPAWVVAVSGMAADSIADYRIERGVVLVVTDTDGRDGHRFTVDPKRTQEG